MANRIYKQKAAGWLSKYQDGDIVIPVRTPDGVKMMTEQEADAYIKEHGYDLPQVTIRPKGPTVNIPVADNTSTVINTPNGPVKTGQSNAGYYKPYGHTWKDVMLDMLPAAAPFALAAGSALGAGSAAVAGLDYLGEMAAPYMAPIVEGLAADITSAIPGLTYGQALNLAGAYAGAQAGVKIPQNLRDKEYADAFNNALEFGLGYGLPAFEYSAPLVKSAYNSAKNLMNFEKVPSEISSEELARLLEESQALNNNYNLFPESTQLQTLTPGPTLSREEMMQLFSQWDNTANTPSIVDLDAKFNTPTQEALDNIRRVYHRGERLLSQEERSLLNMYGHGYPESYNNRSIYRNPTTFAEQTAGDLHPWSRVFLHNREMPYPAEVRPFSNYDNPLNFSSDVSNWANTHGFRFGDIPENYMTRFSHLAEPYRLTPNDLTDDRFLSSMYQLSSPDRANLLEEIYNNIHVPLLQSERDVLFNTPQAQQIRQAVVRNALGAERFNLQRGPRAPKTSVISSKEDIANLFRKAGVSEDDINFFNDRINVNDYGKGTGYYSHSQSDEALDHTLTNPSLLYKTEDIAPTIERLEKMKNALTGNDTATDIIKEKINITLEDLYSTKWLRENRVAELKERGLNPSMELSIITRPSNGMKYLVDKDGNILGNVSGIIIGKHAPFVGASGLRLKFQGLNKEALLAKGYTEEEVGEILLKHLGTQNRLGEALYRGISHGTNAVRGEHLHSSGHFAQTALKNTVTGEVELALRAERFWNKLVKSGYAVKEGNIYKIIKGVTPAMLGKLYLDNYNTDKQTKKLKYGGWLNEYK